MRLLLAYLLLLVSSPALADQLIIEPDMGRAPLIAALEESQGSIKLALYGFTDGALLNALVKEKEKGRDVQVILECCPYKALGENTKAFKLLLQHHIPVQGKIGFFRFVHQKTLLLDGKKAIVATFNFTRSTFKNERNFALVIDDPKRVREMEAIFNADWNHKPTHAHFANALFSPDDSRKHLMRLIGRARQEIKIYAQNINDYKIVGQLAKAAKRGVQVTILASGKMYPQQENDLSHAGVHIHYAKKYRIHAKALLIDNQYAVIGSINLTRASLDDNRELSVISKDPIVIKELGNTFTKDLRSSSRVSRQAGFFAGHADWSRELARVGKKLRRWLAEGKAF